MLEAATTFDGLDTGGGHGRTRRGRVKSEDVSCDFSLYLMRFEGSRGSPSLERATSADRGNTGTSGAQRWQQQTIASDLAWLAAKVLPGIVLNVVALVVQIATQPSESCLFHLSQFNRPLVRAHAS